MALSRIWSAFIIIAVLIASYKFFSGKEKTIFTSMVTGKAGDSVHLKGPEKYIDDRYRLSMDTIKLVEDKGKKLIYKNEDGKIAAIKIQTANGIVETCKDAVNICIGLIGIMALFMGFMAIAEKAGGMRLLSRIIGPFFTKLFPDVPKGHPAH